VEDVILIDDSIDDSVEGQNWIRVPILEFGGDRALYVAAVLQEFLESKLKYSQFLSSTNKDEIFYPSMVLPNQCLDEGLKLLKRINSSLEFCDGLYHKSLYLKR
jgi:disulfide oxidoreductase YuzD